MKTQILPELDAAARAYADARILLRDRAQKLAEIQETLMRRHMRGIRNALAAANDAKAALEAAIEANKPLFAKPKTQTIHGIRLGYAKGKGKIEWADDEALAQRIEKRLPDQYDVLVKVTRKPLKGPLAQLTVEQLRKLGITVEETGDQVYIASTDSQLDKLLKKLLKEGAQETEEADADA